MEDFMIPVKKASDSWALYLGGWKGASFYPCAGHLDSARLEERKKKNWRKLSITLRACALAQPKKALFPTQQGDEGRGWCEY